MENGVESIIMESVDIMRLDDDGVYVENIIGERLKIKAHIKKINLVDHRILLVKD